MRKQIDYVLNYRDKGEEGAISIKIDFVSNWCVREYNDIMQTVFDTRRTWDQIVYKMSEKKSLQVEKPEGFDSDCDLIDAEILSLSDKIKQIGECDILKRRYELLKIILVDNGVKESRLLDFDFWDRCVDPSEINDLLTLCAWKDIDKKKVQ